IQHGNLRSEMRCQGFDMVSRAPAAIGEVHWKQNLPEVGHRRSYVCRPAFQTLYAQATTTSKPNTTAAMIAIFSQRSSTSSRWAKAVCSVSTLVSGFDRWT